VFMLAGTYVSVVAMENLRQVRKNG